MVKVISFRSVPFSSEKAKVYMKPVFDKRNGKFVFGINRSNWC